MAMTTRQQTAKNAVEASRFEGRGNPVSPWKDQSLFSTVNGGVLKNSLVVGTPGKPKVKVQETAQVKVVTIEPLVNAAYVLKSKNDESGYLFDVLRPTESPIKVSGKTSGEEEVAVGNVESPQSSGVGGNAIAPVEEMVDDDLVKGAVEAMLTTGGKGVKVTFSNANAAKKEAQAAMLEKLGKSLKVTKEELTKGLTTPLIRGYLQGKGATFSSQWTKDAHVDLGSILRTEFTLL